MNSLARTWIDDVILRSPVARSMGIRIREATSAEVTVDMPFADEFTTVPGIVHGGVISALVDIVGAAASAAGLQTEDDSVTGGATARLSVNYLAPGRSDLSATAAVVHRSRSTTLSEVRVRDSEGTLVATGEVESRLFR